LNVLSEKSSFGYVEAFKALRTNLTYLLQDHGRGHVLMITSSIPGEGKSNISVNLSLTLAQDNNKVILIDCDLRKGTLHRYLNVPPTAAGLSSVLTGEAPLSETIYKLSYGFHFMPVGVLPNNPSELIGSRNMSKLLSALSKQYDYVICDTAPVNAVADTSILCRYVDGVVFVVSHNDVTRNTVLAAKEQLESSNANILGVVLNKYDAKTSGSDTSKYYSYYNYSNYGYGYDKADQ
jgi:capsular exopolysaccharide synthesis family protein